MPKISVGRDKKDREEHGLKGTGMIGKHLVGENKEAHKANSVYFDLARPHVMGVFGKRGSGKSYSLGTIAEELQNVDIADNLTSIIIDPMGIYWSMKRPNDRGNPLLEDWGLKPQAFDAKVYIPQGKTREFEENEIPFDGTFTLNPGDFTANEWAMAFNIELNSERGILLERAISKLKEDAGNNYKIDNIVEAIRHFDFEEEVQESLVNRFEAAKDWGVFGEESSIEQFTTRGELSIIDVSAYGELSSGWSVRSLLVGLLAKRILRKG